MSQVKETLKEPTSTWLFLLHYKQTEFPKAIPKKILESIKRKKKYKTSIRFVDIAYSPTTMIKFSAHKTQNQDFLEQNTHLLFTFEIIWFLTEPLKVLMHL